MMLIHPAGRLSEAIVCLESAIRLDVTKTLLLREKTTEEQMQSWLIDNLVILNPPSLVVDTLLSFCQQNSVSGFNTIDPTLSGENKSRLAIFFW